MQFSPTMPAITGLSPEALRSILFSWGETETRVRTLEKALYREGVISFEEVSPMRRDLRARLATEFSIPALALAKEQTSEDGTRKFLFRLSDGETVESVLIPDVGKKAGKRALCVSTQVGCAIACRFCLTGLQGLTRNLMAHEIIEQIRHVQFQQKEPLTHIVFMGMGEPLHNLEEVRKALAILTQRTGFGFPERKITVSTAGLTPGLERLARETKVLLALSLHAADEGLRREIMPISKKYPVASLMALIRSLSAKDQERILIEYILLADVNDREEHALQLVELLAGLSCKINLIPFNEGPGLPYQRPNDESSYAFLTILKAAGHRVSLRRARGRDILAACGQLRGTEIESNTLQSSSTPA